MSTLCKKGPMCPERARYSLMDMFIHDNADDDDDVQKKVGRKKVTNKCP